MIPPRRISALETREKVRSGEALLVAVTSPSGYARAHPEGAISWSEFEARVQSLPKTQPIVFY